MQSIFRGCAARPGCPRSPGAAALCAPSPSHVVVGPENFAIPRTGYPPRSGDRSLTRGNSPGPETDRRPVTAAVPRHDELHAPPVPQQREPQPLVDAGCRDGLTVARETAVTPGLSTISGGDQRPSCFPHPPVPVSGEAEAPRVPDDRKPSSYVAGERPGGGAHPPSPSSVGSGQKPLWLLPGPSNGGTDCPAAPRIGQRNVELPGGARTKAAPGSTPVACAEQRRRIEATYDPPDARRREREPRDVPPRKRMPRAAGVGRPQQDARPPRAAAPIAVRESDARACDRRDDERAERRADGAPRPAAVVRHQKSRPTMRVQPARAPVGARR